MSRSAQRLVERTGVEQAPVGDAASPGPSVAPSPRSSSRATPRPSPSSSARATLPVPASPRPPASRSQRASTGQLTDQRKPRLDQGNPQGPVANRWYSPRAQRRSLQKQGDGKDNREPARNSSTRRTARFEQDDGQRSLLQSPKDTRREELSEDNVGQVVYFPTVSSSSIQLATHDELDGAHISSSSIYQQPDEILPGMADPGLRTKAVDRASSRGKSVDSADDMVLNELADATDVMKSVLANSFANTSPWHSVPTPSQAMPVVPPTYDTRIGAPASLYETRRTEERLAVVERQLDEARQMLSIVTDEMSRTTISLCKVHAESLRRDLQKELCDMVDERVFSLMYELSPKETSVGSTPVQTGRVVAEAVNVESWGGRDEHGEARLAVDELLLKLGALDACISTDSLASVPDLTALHNIVKTTAMDVRRLQQQPAEVEGPKNFLQEGSMRQAGGVPCDEAFRDPANEGQAQVGDESQQWTSKILQNAISDVAGAISSVEQAPQLSPAPPSEKSGQYRGVLQGEPQDMLDQSKVGSLPRTNGRSSSVTSSPTPTEGADWQPLLQTSVENDDDVADSSEEGSLPQVAIEAIWPPKTKLDLSFFLPTSSQLQTVDEHGLECLPAVEQKAEFSNMSAGSATWSSMELSTAEPAST